LAEGSDTSKHHELLLRMIDSDGNVVLPGAFLPAAERFNATTSKQWLNLAY